MKDYKLSWFPWNGSKRWIINHLIDVVKSVPKFNNYYDPFVGGGSVSYMMKKLFPENNQIISDANPWLMSAYQIQQNNLEYNIDDIIKNISRYRSLIDSDLENLTIDERAIRFAVCLFTSWGNRWETYNDGKFKSTLNPKFCEKPYLEKIFNRFCSQKWLTQNDKILATDWSHIINEVKENDLVYLDPPYPDSLGYGNQVWDFANQLDVIDWAWEVQKKNVFVLISNMATVERLYTRAGFKTIIIEGPKTTKTRARRKEVIAWNW